MLHATVDCTLDSHILEALAHSDYEVGCVADAVHGGGHAQVSRACRLSNGIGGSCYTKGA